MSTQPVTWSPEQERALELIEEWLERDERQVFRLFGYAGTGKTELVRAIGGMLEEPVFYASYTGKAALVLGRRVGERASTLHRLIYRRLEDRSGDRVQVVWVLNESSPLSEAGLLVVDEVSMVDERLGRDLLSFGVPTLVLGDPFQLPPIGRAGWFTADPPDAMLTQVHRHDGAVLDLATAIRLGEPWREHPGVITEEPEALDAYDVVICGTHRIRREVNERMRVDRGPDPESGDQVVCIRNDYDVGVFNGQTFEVEGDAEPVEEGLRVSLRAGDEVVSVTAPREDFESNECQGFDGTRQRHQGMACLTWGYSLTAHKAQGSQWDRVLVIDEASTFREPARWLYTAVTRAIEDVTVVTAPLVNRYPDDYWD